MDSARDQKLPAGLRIFAYLSYAISAPLFAAHLLWQMACVPPSDERLMKILDEKRADFEALRDLILEDHRRSGRYFLARNDIQFRRMAPARAARYRTLLASTKLRMLKVHPDGAVEFELWGYGLPPDVWH